MLRAITKVLCICKQTDPSASTYFIYIHMYVQTSQYQIVLVSSYLVPFYQKILYPQQSMANKLFEKSISISKAFCKLRQTVTTFLLISISCFHTATVIFFGYVEVTFCKIFLQNKLCILFVMKNIRVIFSPSSVIFSHTKLVVLKIF